MSSENDQKTANDSNEKAAQEATRVGTDAEIRNADRKKDEANAPKNDRLRDGSR